MTQKGPWLMGDNARSPEARLARYAGGRFRAVPGFLNEVGAALIVRISEAQRVAGIAGPVAEIGVFGGRTTTLLYMLTAAPDAVVGIDLFEDGEYLHGHRAASEVTVRRRVQRFAGGAERLALLKRDSGSVSVEELLAKAGGQPFRLFHIDGDHHGAAVRKDLELAFATLGPRGVIVADDFFNPNTPEVFDAIWGFASADTVVPFATAATKMFLCRPADVAFYAAAVRPLEERFERGEWRLLETDVSSFRQPPGAARQRPPLHSRLRRGMRRRARAARRRAFSMRASIPWPRAK